MTTENLRRLQSLIKKRVDFLCLCEIRNSKPPNFRGFGRDLEFLLNGDSREISTILEDIAKEQFEQRLEPPDFSKYVRPSPGLAMYKEVFVGDKWVVVPNATCVDFRDTTLGESRAFTVTVSHENNHAVFTSTESLQEYQESLQGEKLQIKLQTRNEDDFNYTKFGVSAFNRTKNFLGNLDGVNTLYQNTSKDFKRSYAYKISRATKTIGKPAKAGKIFQGAEKISEKLGILGPVGNYLSGGTIIYELVSDTWDAHTIVDGVILVVAVGVTLHSMPIVAVSIAIYGFLDFIFDISEGIDTNFGRDSDFWDKEPIVLYPRIERPLFQETFETKIDNTYVAPTFKLPKFKN